MVVSFHPPMVGPVAYDTALAARIRMPTGTIAFPATMAWLLRHQHADGTWGSRWWSAHDRLINTLAAVAALFHETDPRTTAAVARALPVLPSLVDHCVAQPHVTVGGELILPALLEVCQATGVPVPTQVLPHFAAYRRHRLDHNPRGTSLFSAEALSSNGRVGPDGPQGPPPYLASPAARIGMAPPCYDTARDGWILPLLHAGQGGLPAVYPLDRAIPIWMAWHLTCAVGPHHPLVCRLRAHIRSWWTPQGVAFSSVFPIPDGDDTALAYRVLADGGMPPSIAVLEPYMTMTGARCYTHEHDASVSANVHMLLALRAAPSTIQRDRWMDTILATLRAARTPQGWLTDKWHISPLYATTRAILATHHLDDALCTQLCETILAHQHPDGAWGIQEGTAEETAYALLALHHVHDRHIDAIQAIHAGMQALGRLRGQPWPALWIGKTLYLPRPIVASVISAAAHVATQYQSLRRGPAGAGALVRGGA